MEIKTNVRHKKISKYIRAPKNVVIPCMGDMQSNKNPFNKSTRQEARTIKSTGALINYHKSEEARRHSNTFVDPRGPPCPDFVSVQRHESMSPEVSDSVTADDCDWIIEEQLDDEDNYGELKIVIIQPYELTFEIQHNFSIMESLGKPTLDEIEARGITLPPIKKMTNKTLLLDIDDTLIHTINPKFNYSAMNVKHTTAETVLYKDQETLDFITMRVLIRPYALKLLEELSSIYEIVVFTAGQKCYADSILDSLDPDNKHIDYRLYRDSCIIKNGRYIKDLRIFKNRDLKNVVLVDNSIVSFSGQLSNGIYVPSYFGQQNDNHLKQTIKILKKISTCINVEEELDRLLGLKKLYKEFIDVHAKTNQL